MDARTHGMTCQHSRCRFQVGIFYIYMLPRNYRISWLGAFFSIVPPVRVVHEIHTYMKTIVITRTGLSIGRVKHTQFMLKNHESIPRIIASFATSSPGTCSTLRLSPSFASCRDKRSRRGHRW